jgi:hypothetical protein
MREFRPSHDFLCVKAMSMAGRIVQDINDSHHVSRYYNSPAVEINELLTAHGAWQTRTIAKPFQVLWQTGHVLILQSAVSLRLCF